MNKRKKKKPNKVIVVITLVDIVTRKATLPTRPTSLFLLLTDTLRAISIIRLSILNLKYVFILKNTCLFTLFRYKVLKRSY